MRHVSLNRILINLSLLIFIAIVTIRSYLDAMLSTSGTLVLYLIAIFLLLICSCYRPIQIVKRIDTEFLLLYAAMFLPSLFNNGYLQGHQYSMFFYYTFAIIYTVLLYFTSIDDMCIEFSLKLLLIFAVATSIVTWISYFSPDIYISTFIPLLPDENQQEVYYNFIHFSNRMGLTTHYSRNAFYVILGIIGFLYFYLKRKKKKFLIGILFLFVTMLVIGKRGHLIFFVAALVITYFIYERTSLITILRFMAILCSAIIFVLICVRYVPGASFAFERLFNSDSTDITTGRIDLWLSIWNQFKNNGYFPIGWSQFARSTGWVNPGAHNDYIQIICETGIIGFLMIFGSNFIMLKTGISCIHYAKASIYTIIVLYAVFFLLYSLSGLPHFGIEDYTVYFYLNSVMYRVKKANKLNERQI